MHVRDKVRKAVEERAALDGMRLAFETIIDRREANAERFPDLEERKERLRELRESCVGNSTLLTDAISALRQNGCRVVLAKGSDAAIRVILTELEGQSLVVKSKSNVTKELHLAEALSERGVEVVETDLGDRIVQLQGCQAVHPTGPACHLARGQISELLSAHYGRPISDDPEELTTAVRDEISGFLERAEVGITGANAIAAREGALVIVHNEGNASMCASLPGKHIVVTTPEKVVPSLRDAMDLISLQVYYSTGKVTSAYINVISGPSYTADIEKRIFKGMHGPKEVIVVLVDDGRLSAVDREPLYCIGCGSCLTRCPVYGIIGPVFGTQGHMGGQGVHLLSSTEKLQDAHDAGLFLCTSCGECKEACPVDIDTKKGILKGRQSYNRLKMEQSPEHESVLASVRNYDNPWQMPRARKSRWAKGMGLPSEGEVLFFAGCSTSLLFPDSAKAAVGLLKAAGSEPAYMGVAEKCCGSILRKLGATELARAKAESCFKGFAEAGARTVVTSCPGCYSALDAHVDLKEEYGVEILHISQFLAERMDRLVMGRFEGLGRVTYHDPCDLGRDKGVFDEPRRLVEAASGTTVCEMTRSGKNAACCGAGSGVKSGFPELAMAMAYDRIGQAVSAGADTVVTACPWCVQSLRECQGGDPKVMVIDLVELLSLSVEGGGQRRPRPSVPP